MDHEEGLDNVVAHLNAQRHQDVHAKNQSHHKLYVKELALASPQRSRILGVTAFTELNSEEGDHE
eukprot:3265631-Amphidinium_carterae.1